MIRCKFLAAFERRVYQLANIPSKDPESRAQHQFHTLHPCLGLRASLEYQHIYHISKNGWVYGFLVSQHAIGKVNWDDVMDCAIEHDQREFVRILEKIRSMSQLNICHTAAWFGRNEILVQAERRSASGVEVYLGTVAYRGHIRTMVLLRSWVKMHEQAEFIDSLSACCQHAADRGNTKIIKLIMRWRAQFGVSSNYVDALNTAARCGCHKVLRVIIPHCTSDDISKAISNLDVAKNCRTISFLQRSYSKAKK